MRINKANCICFEKIFSHFRIIKFSSFYYKNIVEKNDYFLGTICDDATVNSKFKFCDATVNNKRADLNCVITHR